MELIKPGARARAIRETPNLYAQPRPWVEPQSCKTGFEFEVSDYVPADEAREDKAFYWGTVDGWRNSVAVLANDVEEISG